MTHDHLKERKKAKVSTAPTVVSTSYESKRRGRRGMNKRGVCITAVLVFTIAYILLSNISWEHHVESREPESHDLRARRIDATTILTSRNWHRMGKCDTVPESYYTLGTPETEGSGCTTPECKHSAEDMIAWFQSCRGTIWIRLQSSRDGDLNTFIEHVLPLMSHKFDLITTEGDNSVPRDVPQAQTLLESPLLKRWFTQNYDGTNHPKVHAIPIGLDMHGLGRPGLWSSTNWEEDFQQMKYIRRKEKGHRTNELWIPPMANSGAKGERLRAREVGAKCGGVNNHLKRGEYRMNIGQMWGYYTQYRFGLSPPGNGMDCHRTWEMLFFGMIPVVLTSGLDDMYKDLPVVIVQDWEDLCRDGFLDQQYLRLKHKLPLPEEAFTMAPYLK